MGSHAAGTRVSPTHHGTTFMWIVFAAAIAILAVAALLSAEAAAGVETPWFTIEPDSCEVYGGGWNTESQVTIEIDDVSSPGGPEFTGYDETDASGWFEVQSSQFNVGFTIAPGDTVAVTVGGTTRVHVVRFLTSSGFNLTSDAVWGTAAAGTTVTVGVRNDREATVGERVGVAGGAGDWTSTSPTGSALTTTCASGPPYGPGSLTRTETRLRRGSRSSTPPSA